MADRENTAPEVARGEAGKWLPGTSPNPGGRPKKLVEIERMLDEEHRNPANMRKVFKRLRGLATRDRVKTIIDKKGNAHDIVMPPDPAFMKLYLERVMGPVKDLAPDDFEKLLENAPPEAVKWLASLDQN